MTQTPASTPPAATFKARSAYGVGLLSIGLGIATGAGLSTARSWATGAALTTSVGTAGAVWLIAVILAVQVLVLGTGLKVDRLGLGMLASSMARMLMALLIGLIAFFVIKPEGMSFWVTFLACGLFALIGEAFWAIRTINAATRPADARTTTGAV